MQATFSNIIIEMYWHSQQLSELMWTNGKLENVCSVIQTLSHFVLLSVDLI